MRERNFYKGIVWTLAFCLLVAAVVRRGGDYAKERTTYGFLIQAKEELTADIVEEFRKLSGIRRFTPTDTAAVTIRIGTYAMETDMMGIDFETYPVKWERLSEEAERGAGNVPLLFFGKDAFFSLVDSNGYAPLKRQVEKWMNAYQALDVTVADENGRERKAKICGILERPGSGVCMEKRQMKEAFGGCVHTAGGFLAIDGCKNTETARGLLEDAGFVVEEACVLQGF